jgi:hypothetical protein
VILLDVAETWKTIGAETKNQFKSQSSTAGERGTTSLPLALTVVRSTNANAITVKGSVVSGSIER